MEFNIEKLPNNGLKISFSGRLDIDSIPKIWSKTIGLVDKEKPLALTLDFSEVEYCDGAGIALIQKLQELQGRLKNKCIIKGLKKEFDKLLKYIGGQSSEITQKVPSKKSLPTKVGKVTLNILTTLQENITFLGKLSYQLLRFLFKLRRVRWQDVLRIAEDAGPRALPIVALIGFLIGLISTFQAAPSFAKFGAQIYMVNLVGLGLVREMGPLLTSVLLAGRTASSFAAEIGTMKINQEVDALTTMGLNPIFFLVIPRVLVVTLIVPILEVFFIIFGLLGCWAVMITLGYTTDAFFHQLYQAIKPLDYLGGLIKVFVFGLVIASTGCLHGIKTHFGSQAVGRSTTQAVVSSLIMLVVVDGVFALIYYVLGI